MWIWCIYVSYLGHILFVDGGKLMIIMFTPLLIGMQRVLHKLKGFPQPRRILQVISMPLWHSLSDLFLKGTFI